MKGLSEKTTRDGLISYMEVISKFQEVSDVEFDEQGCALVTFKDEYGKPRTNTLCRGMICTCYVHCDNMR